jgi:hypothetical protein
VMVDQSLRPTSNFWADIALAVGIGILIVTLIVSWVFLDLGRFVPRWVFGWISDDGQTAKLQFGLVVLGLFASLYVMKLAKLGVLGDVVKGVCDAMRSTISFGRLGKRPRE